MRAIDTLRGPALQRRSCRVGGPPYNFPRVARPYGGLLRPSPTPRLDHAHGQEALEIIG